MRLRYLRSALVLAATLLLAACGGGGGRCDTCSSDADCDESKGYICERYEDGVNRCGDPSKRFDTCPAKD